LNTILPPFIDAYDVCNPDTHFIQLGGNNIAFKKSITPILADKPSELPDKGSAMRPD
jgi:hypothetical protein